MDLTRHIPNTLTIFNLACGVFGIVAAFRGDLQTAAIMIWAGALFDFLDGSAARLLNKFSSIGKDLDSLADLITFCMLPGAILFELAGQNSPNSMLSYTGFLLVIFGALRLAKFNNDTRQSETFYGLPVPASAIFVSGLPFALSGGPVWFSDAVSSLYAIATIAIILSFMMVSDIKLMSLKFKNFSLANNWPRYVLLVGALILLILFKAVALPVVIILYVVLSVTLNVME